MKTLHTIQTLSKIGKILSQIVFICCLVGGIASAVGILGLALIPGSLRLGDVTIHGIIEQSAGVSLGTCYAAAAAAIVYCAGEAVLSRLAWRYFKNELAAGTPFTFDGARELRRLGICTICIPIGTAILAGILRQILTLFFSDIAEFSNSGSVSVGLGIMFIVCSLLCRYATEQAQGRASVE